MLADLRRALIVAMKARDAVAVSALRSALAAIENATAVDPGQAPSSTAGSIAGGVAGLGAGEVARRTLTPADTEALLRAEVDQRLTAAAEYAALGRADQAERLRAEAAVLSAHLPSAHG